MTQPKLLDLFCKAGGAARGYALAGFEVIGVDLHPQPNYPYEFIQADVLDLTPSKMAVFDAIHASPPCQGYTALRHAPGTVGAPCIIPAVRDLLVATGRPYVIENVEEAKADMIDPVTLCGSMFGLEAQGHWLQRHRLFETNWDLTVSELPHHHDKTRPVIGVYGGHARRRSAKAGGRGTRDAWEGGHKAAASEALGIDWMTLEELSEAIPPAYTQWIGSQLLRQLQT